jgi:hypothetical protein
MIAFVSRGRADRTLPPTGFAKIFGDKAVIPTRQGKGRRSAARVSPSWRPRTARRFCCRTPRTAGRL